MKDYKTLTREKVDVEPGAARYMGETHMMEDWSDKMIDLVLNGPTLNGFKKDELRAMLRQTYAALKQYEQIGPMASPYMNDPSAIVARAFAELYPGIDYHAQFVPDLCDESGNRAFGLTIFPDDGSAPIVCISAEAPISAAPELLAHELAPYSNAGGQRPRRGMEGGRKGHRRQVRRDPQRHDPRRRSGRTRPARSRRRRAAAHADPGAYPGSAARRLEACHLPYLWGRVLGDRDPPAGARCRARTPGRLY